MSRLQELEAASRRQRRILEDIQEALNDMNINTASRLNVLEAIAKRQRQVLNDLLIEEEEHFQLFSGSDEQLDLNILRQQQQPRTLQVTRDQRRLELARSHPL